MEQRLSVVTLGVADLEASRCFYEDGLGWRRGNDHNEIVFFQLPGAVLALFSRTALAADARLEPEGSGFGGITLAYCTRSHEEVDAVLAKAEAAGARILKPAQDAFWGGYSGYFADPDGHPWEVAWNPDWRLDAEGRVSLSDRGRAAASGRAVRFLNTGSVIRRERPPLLDRLAGAGLNLRPRCRNGTAGPAPRVPVHAQRQRNPLSVPRLFCRAGPRGRAVEPAGAA